MKNGILIIIATIVVIISFNSCKKENHDIIVGKWKLISGEYIHNHTSSNSNYNYAKIFNGSILTSTYNNETTTHSYSDNMTINEDGNLKVVITLDTEMVETEFPWMWLDSDEEKSMLLLPYDDFTHDYETIVAFTVKELSETKLVIEYFTTYIETGQDPHSGNERITKTYERQ